MRIRVFTALALLILVAAAMPVAAQQQPAPKSLYDRLGGIYPIAGLVDDFIDRVFVNTTINANPNIYKARKEERKAGLKMQVSTLVCSVTGGPCKYTGLDMKAAHKDFHITEKEWQALMVDFRASLAKFKVPPAEQKELIDIVESTKGDMVTPPQKVMSK
jgi:hemoglobin